MAGMKTAGTKTMAFLGTAALAALASLGLLGAGPAKNPAAPEVTAAYRQEMEDWRADREKGLKNENGWFTLVGLFWLHEGENRVGTDPGGTVIFPDGKSAPRVATLVRQGDAVRLQAEPGSGITLDGKSVTTLDLKDDMSGEASVLHLGSLSFFVIRRGDKLGVRVKDSQAPALAAFHGLDNFPVDPSWRVTARFEPYDPPKNVPVPNVLGQVTDTPSPGALVFERGGQTYRLDTLGQDKDGALSTIFADLTNGKESYGAGRFLDTEPVKDGKVVVDFNKAYNPPCAFSAFATCPLPPAQNKLALKVEAGEKKYGEGHH